MSAVDDERGPVVMAVAMVAALVELVLPARCAGCGEPARLLCRGCRAGLHGPSVPARPDPAPPGLPGTWATGSYDGALRAAIIAHKEHGRLALARPLGDALALAVTAALGARPPSAAAAAVRRPVALVPAPSRAAAVRSRGHDPTLRLARRAAVVLRRGGLPTRVLPVVRASRGLADQSGLDAAGRAANLEGALSVPRRLAPQIAGVPTVVVDDVVTTGATLVETARAAAESGAVVLAGAVAATTARRAGSRRTPV